MLAVAFALLAGGATAVQAGEPMQGSTVLRLERYLGSHHAIKLQGGNRRARFLFDTAGGLTVVTPEFANALGCVPWGRLTAHRMRGDRVDVPRCDGVALDAPGTSLRVETAGVWDFRSLLPPSAPALDGSLALDAFEGRAVTIDLGGGMLVIESGASLPARLQGAEELPFRIERGVQGRALVPFVGLETPKGILWLELDCGSDAPLILSRHALEALPVAGDEMAGYRLTMSLRDGIHINTKVKVMDLIIDGNIGAPLLRDWIVTMDLEAGRLWVRKRTIE